MVVHMVETKEDGAFQSLAQMKKSDKLLEIENQCELNQGKAAWHCPKL